MPVTMRLIMKEIAHEMIEIQIGSKVKITIRCYQLWLVVLIVVIGAIVLAAEFLIKLLIEFGVFDKFKGDQGGIS